MRTYFLIPLLASLLFFGCKKKEEPTSPRPPVSNLSAYDYYPLDSGNYWIYENFIADSNGHITIYSYVDSVFLFPDTLLKGNIFKVVAYHRQGGYVISFLRDSSGYLVDDEGIIKMSPVNFTDTLFQYSFTQYVLNGKNYTVPVVFKMEKVPNPFNVPAGKFMTINYQGTIHYPNIEQFADTPYQWNNLYAYKIGKIYESNPVYENGLLRGKRLIRYHINAKN